AFEPLDPERVRMYVCGPTVYDEAHIGNARAITAFDLLYRVLRHEYGEDHVTYVRNITDVEDKIMAAAKASGQTIDQVTQRTTAQFHADMAALGNLPPDIEPRATEYIPQMIALIERLIASGHAYAAEGHALFRVGSYPEYGKLSRRSRRDMIAGARVEVAPYKEDPGDFVLWKPSTPDQPGWDSPWGRGRPGWHIECSAMSENTLGETFDIHGGGLDLIFPHHENEIAQSVCAHDGKGPADFARYWLHNGMLTVGGSKMAKSEGNFITVRQALAQAPGEVVRLALLMTHYRDPLDWTDDKLHQARATLDRWYRALKEPSDWSEKSEVPHEVHEALTDDLNTPLAIARLHELAATANRCTNLEERKQVQSALAAGGRLMGLLDITASDWLLGGETMGKSIELRIAERALARRERRFTDADRIRAELADLGIILEDRPDGTTEWRSA
ncbi:MAG TPA: cysteine--tRNA ligase, partial [Stellaceae bacterium]|nr:cysteine--tRNA ligase [Stellaceae bacterium]